MEKASFQTDYIFLVEMSSDCELVNQPCRVGKCLFAHQNSIHYVRWATRNPLPTLQILDDVGAIFVVALLVGGPLPVRATTRVAPTIASPTISGNVGLPCADFQGLNS
jgi:hypothetical protein